MEANPYRTTPDASSKLPGGIPYIIGNEAAERFSFYGMKAILVVFMTKYIMGTDGSVDPMTDDEAKAYTHLFVSSAYFMPILGAIIADAFLGKYKTIISLSIVYCLGHFALALDETRVGLTVGLTLIAIGAGGIKPCVSAHVGDQFGTHNHQMLSKVFSWFYFSINLGACVSTLLTPVLLRDDRFGPSVAFGVPGALMLLATWVFWLGRHKFIHVPPAGMGAVREAFSGEGLTAIKNLSLIYICVAMFWSVFDQTASAWVLQSRRMDREFLGIDLLPSQIQAVNPFLILLFIPLFSYIIYPFLGRFFEVTPLRKIAVGFFVTVAASATSAWIESEITGGEVISVSSEGDKDQFPVENILSTPNPSDATTRGRGWISEANPEFPQEIVLRLRERRAWNISSVRVHTAVNLYKFLQDHTAEVDKPDNDSPEHCAAREIDLLISESRNGPWRSMGTMSLDWSQHSESVEFPTVETEYVMVRIHANHGGDFVSLGRVEVLSPDSSPAAGHTLPTNAKRYADAVWPNVAAIGYQPNIVWQFLAYALLTAAEIMISITCLEFSYTQAPRKMKSFIMSVFLLSVALGNAFTFAVNVWIQEEDGSSKLEGASYYWFFTAMILVTAVAFLLVSKTYHGRTYVQGGNPDKGADDDAPSAT